LLPTSKYPVNLSACSLCVNVLDGYLAVFTVAFIGAFTVAAVAFATGVVFFVPYLAFFLILYMYIFIIYLYKKILWNEV
jgi:hypothetical protein